MRNSRRCTTRSSATTCRACGQAPPTRHSNPSPAGSRTSSCASHSPTTGYTTATQSPTGSPESSSLKVRAHKRFNLNQNALEKLFLFFNNFCCEVRTVRLVHRSEYEFYCHSFLLGNNVNLCSCYTAKELSARKRRNTFISNQSDALNKMTSSLAVPSIIRSQVVEVLPGEVVEVHG